MTVVDRMERFSGQFGKRLVVDGVGWRYYGIVNLSQPNWPM